MKDEVYLCDVNGTLMKVEILCRIEDGKYIHIMRMGPGYMGENKGPWLAWITKEDFERDYKIVATI